MGYFVAMNPWLYTTWHHAGAPRPFTYDMIIFSAPKIQASASCTKWPLPLTANSSGKLYPLCRPPPIQDDIHLSRSSSIQKREAVHMQWVPLNTLHSVLQIPYLTAITTIMPAKFIMTTLHGYYVYFTCYVTMFPSKMLFYIPSILKHWIHNYQM